MENKEFTKEDIGKVVIVNGVCDEQEFINEKGKIVDMVDIAINEPRIGVEFGEKRKIFHSCLGKGKEGYCWWIHINMVTLKKYKVYVERTVYQTGFITVSAENGYKAIEITKEKIEWGELKVEDVKEWGELEYYGEMQLEGMIEEITKESS